MKLIKNTFTILLLMVLAVYAQAQTIQVVPATTPPFTPNNLLQQVFLGDGVEVLSINYTGDPNAIGYFKLGSQDIGMYDGIVMSSGNVTSVPTANNVSGGTSGATSGGADPDLNVLLSPSTSQNSAVYTIDFIPSSDTLRFNFVFASEEYPEYVCSFNDGFGFFISGPGITGPYTNMATNVALVPGTNTQILVGTVNGGVAVGGTPPCILTNNQYYINNDNVIAPAQSPYEIEFDGFTTVMQATAVVQPCNTYRIKLAVSDANDQVFDTAVFLEANSFGTNGLRVFAETPSLTNSIAEGCTPGVINFELDEPADGNYNLSYTLGGSAVYGVDYDSIPTSAVIPNGQTSLQIPIHAYADNIAEGTDTIELIVNITPCIQDTFYIYIDDAILETPSVADSTICFGDSVTLDATIGTPIPGGFTFVNDSALLVDDSFGATYIDVSGVPMFNVQVGTIDSVCVDIVQSANGFPPNIGWAGDVDLYLIAPDGQFLELSTDNGGSTGTAYVSTCFTPSATQDITMSIPPFTGNFMPEGDWSDLSGAPVNGLWRLQMGDDQLGFSNQLTRWSISFAPAYGYSYAWSPTDSISCTDCPITTVYPDSTTDYIIDITDSYGCVNSDTASITVGYPLPATVASCDSVSTNSVHINWTAVDSAISYLVSVDGGAPTSVTGTTFTLPNAAPSQTYSFEIETVGGFCPPNGIDTVTCTTLPCTMVATLLSTVNVTCSGQTDGSASFSATGGFGNYYYSLNGGAPQTNNGVFNNLTNGGYQMIVTDDDGCRDTINFTITAPPGVTTTSSSSIASCFGGNDGTATVAATGGTPGYLYSWSTMPAQNTPTATGLMAGDYYVTVTDANNCFVIDTVTIGQNTAVTSNMSSTIVSCNGGSDGTATVTPSGGTPGYTYLWDANANNQITATATGLAIGTYIVTITDANNCTGTDTVTITENGPITVSTTSTLVTCSGGTDGTATVTPSGGVGGFTYLWDANANNQTTATAVNLTTATYFVTVTDANNCTAVDTVTVGTNNPIILTTSNTLASCLGINNGSATVSATGGAGNYTYQWDANANNQTTATATNLGFGSYLVTVTDANNCFDTVSVFVGIATTLTSTTSGTDVSCYGGNDGTASIVVGNGAAPYTYNWSLTGAPNADNISNLIANTYAVTATDVNGCFVVDSFTVNQPPQVATTTAHIGVSCNGGSDGTASVTIVGGTAPYTYQWSTNPMQITSSATGLSAGQYFATVTDANNCIYVDSVIVTEPTVLSLTTNVSNVSCNGTNDGQAWVTVSGGTAPYSYAWDNSPPSTTDTMSNVFAGTYNVTVTDANNCMATATVTITEPAAPLTSGVLRSDVSCNGGNDGTATAIPVGGTPPYTYGWSNTMTTANINGLTAGTYAVLITDNNGCQVIDSTTLTEPTPIVLTLAQTSASCHDAADGTATVLATGGTPDSLGNYSYSWNSNPPQTDTIATGLTGGITYLVVATDDNGCTQDGTITIDNPAEIELTVNVANTNCFGDDSGEATVTPTGGTAPYTYQWSSNANNQTTASADSLGVGTYTVTVTDANGCSNTASATITQPNLMTASFNSFEVFCKGESTGTASVSVVGGTPGYSYQWDANAGNSDSTVVTNLAAGTYYVSITDATGCTIVDSVSITEPALALTAVTRLQDVTCFGDRDGEITILATGGTGPYQYSYDSVNYGNSFRLLGLPADNYTVYVKDAFGCIFSIDSNIITEPLEMTVDLGQDIQIVLSEDTTLIPIITNGIPPYTFAWTPIDSFLTCNDCQQPDVVGLQDREIYFLQVTDAMGCTATDDIIIDVDKPRIVYVANAFTPNNDGVNDWLFVQGDNNTLRAVSFSVYDRWGELVFENRDFEINNPNTGWDGQFKGKTMQSGTFGWILEVEFVDGERRVYKGNTAIIR